MLFTISITLVCLFVSTEAVATEHYGREFYFGMPLNEHETAYTRKKCNTTAIDIASRQSGTIQLTAFLSPTEKIDRTLTLNNGHTSIDIPCRITRLGNFTEKRGVYLKTDVDVAVYATTYYRATVDTFLVLPLQSLGTRYVVSSYQPLGGNEVSYVSVIGAHDNTSVVIHDAQNTTIYAHVLLGSLDMFQQTSLTDLTNLVVESDKPVVVFAGTSCANVPYDVRYCDLIAEQMIPVDNWSKAYIVPPIVPQSAFEVRTLKGKVTDQAQVCTHSWSRDQCSQPSQAFNSSKGYIFQNESVVVTSKDAIAVIQYGVGNEYDTNDEGDPFMAIVPGLDNYLNSYYFAVPHVYSYGYDNFLAVIIDANSAGKLTLDGQAVDWNSTFHVKPPLDRYKVLIATISPGFHVMETTDQSSFGLIVYGYNPLSGYGYPAGMLLPTSNTVATTSVQAGVGDLLQLPCGDPSMGTATYTWTKEHSCADQIKSFEGSTYEVAQANLGDFGIYTCTAKNGASDAVHSYSVMPTGNNAENLCTFDDGTLCGWSQVPNDVFDWTVQNGPTLTDGTGPQDDHTQANGKGMYLFIESSAPRVRGDVARLGSHNLPAGIDLCFTLWHYMFGDGIGTLRVLIDDSCSHEEREVFRLSGDQGEKWQPAYINIPKAAVPNDYTVIVEATVGPSYNGDIAIDDLQFKLHHCSGHGSTIVG